MKFIKISAMCVILSLFLAGCTSGQPSGGKTDDAPAAVSSAPAAVDSGAASGKEESKDTVSETKNETDTYEGETAAADEEEISEERVDIENNPDIGELDDEPSESSMYSQEEDISEEDFRKFEEGGARAE